MTTDVIIPPWIQPQAETTQLVDDSTSIFRPAYAPGAAQRVSYVEPRLKVKQTYTNLRGFERAAMLQALNRAKGRSGSLRAAVGFACRGSFPTGELLTNANFASGTTGWSATGFATIAATDRLIRARRSQGGQFFGFTQSPAGLSANTVYGARCNFLGGLGPTSFSLAMSDNQAEIDTQTLTDSGYAVGALTTATGTLALSAREITAAGTGLTGDFFDLNYSSLSRCALADNGLNLLLQTGAFDNAAWTKVAATINPNTADPAGGTTGDQFTETTATSTHEVQQSITVSSALLELSFGVVIKANGRTWAQIALTEATGSTTVSAYFNLSTGAVGTTATGANWASLRTFAADYGNGWWYIGIVATKNNAATSINHRILAASANGTNSYTGTTSSVAFTLWNAASTQCGVPGRPNASTSAQTLSGSQPANGIYLKGLPASTSGLLLAGDAVEINGELKIATSSLDSDGAGCGFLKIAPTMFRTPTDGDPVFITQPIGKFMLASDPQYENLYGSYLNVSIDLEAIVE